MPDPVEFSDEAVTITADDVGRSGRAAIAWPPGAGMTDQQHDHDFDHDSSSFASRPRSATTPTKVVYRHDFVTPPSGDRLAVS